jgi:hypothetical protein
MVVAALAVVASVVAWQAFKGPSADGAVLISGAGPVPVHLAEGQWGLYSEVVGGVQQTPGVAADGPADLEFVSTVGFYADTTTIDLSGATYQVFATFDVPTDGDFEFRVVDGAVSENTPVVVGHYDDDATLAIVVLVLVGAAVLLGAAGLVLLVVGLVVRSRARGSGRPA